MLARILLTVLLLVLSTSGVGLAFFFSLDAEGRGGNYILAGMGFALVCLLAIFPVWMAFRH